MEPLFKKYPKTPRLYREVVITEKLDGTNGTIIIRHRRDLVFQPDALTAVERLDGMYGIYAGSRNRLLTIEDDNYGFAAWVKKNAEALVALLGEGRFSGEWYGQGIQKNPYGLDHKRFALFRTDLMQSVDESAIEELETVPVLYEGIFYDDALKDALAGLNQLGSMCMEGPFYRGEGVCMYHKDSGQVFKHTHDNESKGSK